MFRALSASLVAVSLLTFLGCESNHYEIELTPKNGSLQRDLTAWRQTREDTRNFPEDELARIAEAYDAKTPEKLDQKHRFSGTFSEGLPDDVGGAGQYLVWKSNLGTASAYVERIRGDDDYLGDVETRLETADRLADLLIAWLKTEIEDEPKSAALFKFLDGPLRRDLKNLSLQSWKYGLELTYDESLGWDFLIRSAQYLLERDYFESAQLPGLMRAFCEAESGQPGTLLQIVRRFAADKMGAGDDQPIPKSLDFLLHEKAVLASLNKFLRETDEYQNMLKDWERDQQDNNETPPPEPTRIIGELVMRALGVTFPNPDRVTVRLKLLGEPAITNGNWNPESRQVEWSKAVLPHRATLPEFPVLLHAVWSDPHAERQSKVFGRVLLKGRSLVEYCLWFEGLSQAEAKEWEDFLSTLKPGDDFEAKLKAFHFKNAENLTDIPRRIFKSARESQKG